MPENIVILTGAGLSAESGLGTFRDKDGLWTQYDLEEVATPEGFARNPTLVQDFYNARRANCRAATPNAAHHALARLARDYPGTVTLVTQNIDDMLERALRDASCTSDVIHMHGELARALCNACGHRWDAPAEMHADDPCPACGRAATRPDVVWFGEIPYHMEAIDTALSRATLFAAIGTSGEVYPAAGFVQIAREMGAHTVELNLDPSANVHIFDETRPGPATQTVPAWVNALLA
ncbi:NAD-dependent deacylase [Rhodalgimonas zhirmunskyi]|uniref:NAD-dependent protein deacylase n=1 Tax=Rhodalgimonas zhirmunskyi TaxID=2964767 RepID=A0AAJ1X5R8_9RHOB|nr:NAD-dependent deacylase [Rhodoalgimonas zhirmunskyi]MDQ2094776.1 NAD-dependent deacylase [Rhodoalgimonas zhirmunskyi]